MKTLAMFAFAACLAGCAAAPSVQAPVARIDPPAFRAGATWIYDEIDPYRREVVGSLSEPMAGVALRQPFDAPYTKLPFPIEAGTRWNETVQAVGEQGATYTWRIGSRARGWERTRTPAGEFDALRIERQMILGNSDFNWRDTVRLETLWYAPAVNGWVRVERRDSQLEMATLNPRSRDDWRVWELREHRGG